MGEQEWLDGLKVGDDVIVTSGNWSSRNQISTVERITKTLFVLARCRKFRRCDGRAPGGGYYYARIEEPTRERVQEIRRMKLVDHMRACDWGAKSLEILEAVYSIAGVRGG